MPARPGRRVIPIHTTAKTEFRLIGGKLYLDRPEKAITWASCQTKDGAGVQHAKPPKFVTRSFGTQKPGLVTFEGPKFSVPTPSCIDDKLKQK